MSPDRPQSTLRTERLILRPFTHADAPAVQRLAGEFLIADTTLNIPHPYEDGMAEAWIDTHEPGYQDGTVINFAIVLPSSSELIGAIALMPNIRFDRAELGYWIGRDHWNTGYCTEAARAVLEYGFRELGLNRIYATHLTRNPASGKVMQKLGMAHEGYMRQHVKRWDKHEDLEMYGILRCDWSAVYVSASAWTDRGSSQP